MSALAWCPWCRDDASANGARVSAVAAPRGAGGCALTPWDGGGWECAECGARAPRQAWAQAQRWQEASDAQRARAEAAEAEVARLRAALQECASIAHAAATTYHCDACNNYGAAEGDRSIALLLASKGITPPAPDAHAKAHAAYRAAQVAKVAAGDLCVHVSVEELRAMKGPTR